MTLRDGENCSANVSEVCLSDLSVRVLHTSLIFTSCLNVQHVTNGGKMAET